MALPKNRYPGFGYPNPSLPFFPEKKISTYYWYRKHPNARWVCQNFIRAVKSFGQNLHSSKWSNLAVICWNCCCHRYTVLWKWKSSIIHSVCAGVPFGAPPFEFTKMKIKVWFCFLGQSVRLSQIVLFSLSSEHCNAAASASSLQQSGYTYICWEKFYSRQRTSRNTTKHWCVYVYV